MFEKNDDEGKPSPLIEYEPKPTVISNRLCKHCSHYDKKKEDDSGSLFCYEMVHVTWGIWGADKCEGFKSRSQQDKKDEGLFEEVIKITEEEREKREKAMRSLYEKTELQPWFYKREKKKYETRAFRKWKEKRVKGIAPEDENLKKQIEIISAEFLDEYDIITLEDTKQMFIKNRNAYLPDLSKVDNTIKDKILGLDKGMYKTIKSNMLEIIADSTKFNRKNFYIDPFFINFPNGTYDFQGDKFLELEEVKDRKYFYEMTRDYKNDKRYNCPIFKRELRSWIYPQKTLTHFLIWDIFEMIGLCMSLNTSFKKAFISYGPKNSGKTQFMNIIGSLFDDYNKSTTSLQRISKNEFGTDNLQFKVINTCDDMPERKVFSLGLFKDLTGGGITVQGELKGGKKFNFTAYAKFWFNANIIPEVENYRDDAGFERFILIPFLNKFSQSVKGFRPDFFRKIISNEDEMQGIIHESIKGFKRLLKRNGFREQIIRNSKHIWIYESDPLYRFIYDNCKQKSNGRVEWEVFKELFNAEMLVSYTPQKLKKSIERLGLAKKKGSEDNEKKFFVCGVEWKDGCDPDAIEAETDKIDSNWFFNKYTEEVD